MQRSRKALTLTVGACLFFQQLALADRQLALPGPDLIAPEIKYTPKSGFKPGEPVRIEATVTDNVGVTQVTLFYRSTGNSDYRRVQMARKPNTDIYWAVLPNSAGPRVEYYLQASDAAGNTLLRGRSFDPLTLTVPASTVAAVPELGTGKPAATEQNKGGISKWVWIGLGVLAAGAVGGALALGGGGGGGGSNASPAGSSSSGGTVTVTAPVP